MNKRNHTQWAVVPGIYIPGKVNYQTEIHAYRTDQIYVGVNDAYESKRVPYGQIHYTTRKQAE
jgi:hypothetical protein